VLHLAGQLLIYLHPIYFKQIFRLFRKPIAKANFGLMSVCPSVRPSEWNSSTSMGQNFVEWYVVDLVIKAKFG